MTKYTKIAAARQPPARALLRRRGRKRSHPTDLVGPRDLGPCRANGATKALAGRPP